VKTSSPENILKSNAIDPSVRNLTPEQVSKDVAAFTKLLNSKARESKLQTFLASHSYFFSGMIDPYAPSPLYSKVKLGHDYEVDFAWLYYDSFGPEWRLIEIENPNTSLFTKSGNASFALNHAIQQARDWAAWVHDHPGYAKTLMPTISYPFCYIFMGRRKDLTPRDIEKLKRYRYDHRKELEIHTLDWFVRHAQNFGRYVGPEGPTWQLPKKARTHKELKNGLPEEVLKWVDGERSQRMAEHRIDQRTMRFHHQNEPPFGQPEVD